MQGEEPTCSGCGYPIRTNEHAPDCPSRKEKEKSPEKRLQEITLELGRIVETKDVDELARLLAQADQLWSTLESRDGKEKVEASLEWYDQNNHRINLYQIAGQHSEGWEGEEITPERGAHLLALKRIDIILKQFAQSEDRAQASHTLERVLLSGKVPEHNMETVIDTLARLSKEGGRVLEAYASDEQVPLNRRLRAVLSRHRFGESSQEFVRVSEEVLTQSAESTDPRILNAALELCGVLGGERGRKGLRVVEENMQKLASDQRQWLDRDLISVQLALEPDAMKSLNEKMNGRVWKSESGIVFGSIAPSEDFSLYIERNREKLEQLAVALKRTNEAFGSEPVLYVDLISDRGREIANEGWTQNTIYLSQTLTEHPRVSTRTTIQGAIHEACERWESKGFVDAGMEADYIRLIGTTYETSELDKFRLRHRYDIPSRAGHPWDGTREYMAEAGSILLADPEKQSTLFDAQKDQVALQALRHVQELIQEYSARHSTA